MRGLAVLFLFSAVCWSPEREAYKQDSEKFAVEIGITQTSSYCGGMRPPVELVKELETPRPIPLKTVYLKKGDLNRFNSEIFMELVSDSAGIIQVQLSPGKYLVVDEVKKDGRNYHRLLHQYSVSSADYSAIDTACLRKWYEQPDLVFEVVNTDLKHLHINFHKKCFWNELPCTEFKGLKPQ